MQTQSFCWHQGHFYIAGGDLTRWKPSASHGHCLVAKDVGTVERVAISPQGEVYLIMRRNAFPSFRYELWVYDSHETLEQDQPTTVVETDAGSWINDCSCSPDGAFYMLWGNMSSAWDGVTRLSGSNLVPVPVNFPPGFVPDKIFASRGEVLYIAGHTEDENSDSDSSEMYTERLILRVDPGQSEPVVVGQGQGNVPYGLFVTDAGKIYMATRCGIEIFNTGDTTAVRMLDLCVLPMALLVQEEALYVLGISGPVWKFAFPPAIELE